MTTLQSKLECYESFLSQHRRPASVKKAMSMLRPLLAEGVGSAQKLLARDAEGLSPYTVKDRTAALRAFGKWAKIPSLEKVKLPRAGGMHRDRAVFSAAEVAAVATCEAIPEERRLFYRLLYRVGLRVKEAFAVTRSSVRQSGQGWQLRLPQAVQKAGREDALPIPADLAEDLKRLAPASPEGWQPHVGTRFTIGRKFDRDLRLAGMEPWQGDAHRTPYDLRSFFVTELLRKGVPIPVVQKLARHSDPQTTLRHYARVMGEEAADMGAQALEGL